MITGIFPTPVYQGTLTTGLKKSDLKNIEKRKNKLNFISTNKHILKHFPKLKKEIEQHLDNYLQEVHDPSTKVKIYITESWLNFTKKGEEHHRHHHPNSFISGVYYISVDEKVDRIEFVDDYKRLIEIVPKKYTTWNSSGHYFEVKNNGIILFPSHLDHFVRPVESNMTRVSLSFNTFVKGEVGSRHHSTYLKI